MLEKFFRKKEDKKSESVRSEAPRPSKPRDPETPRVPREPREPRGTKATEPTLKVGADSKAAEDRARAAMAAVNASEPATNYHFDLPEEAGVREEAAGLFAVGEHKRAIDLLVGTLGKTAGRAPKPIWFMLMDAYQALGQQAAFEKSASLYANVFKVSPPSWERETHEPSVQNETSMTVGRHVMVLDGQPSHIHPEKLRDFIAAARKEGRAKLDLSRSRLDEDHVQRVEDLRALLGLMRRLRHYQIETMLMGENQVVEVLRTVIQRDLPVPSADFYWELLLEFLQWRGQEEAFESLAIQFADRFHRSAPGYEVSGVVAQAPTETVVAEDEGGVEPPPVLDENAMAAWCTGLRSNLPLPEALLWLDFRKVQYVTYDAALHFASRLKEWGRQPEQLAIEQPNELVSALFDITGVAAQVTVIERRR